MLGSFFTYTLVAVNYGANVKVIIIFTHWIYQCFSHVFKVKIKQINFFIHSLRMASQW